jgi:hypothetical protein
LVLLLKTAQLRNTATLFFNGISVTSLLNATEAKKGITIQLGWPLKADGARLLGNKRPRARLYLCVSNCGKPMNEDKVGYI